MGDVMPWKASTNQGLEVVGALEGVSEGTVQRGRGPDKARGKEGGRGEMGKSGGRRP